MNPAETRRMPSKAKSRKEVRLVEERRRNEARIAPNGKRKAAVIPALVTPWSVRG
jgi:hypothetical protein